MNFDQERIRALRYCIFMKCCTLQFTVETIPVWQSCLCFYRKKIYRYTNLRYTFLNLNVKDATRE